MAAKKLYNVIKVNSSIAIARATIINVLLLKLKSAVVARMTMMMNAMLECTLVRGQYRARKNDFIFAD